MQIRRQVRSKSLFSHKSGIHNIKMKLASLVLIQILIVVNCDTCQRPPNVLTYEEECFQEHAGFIEKVSQKATSLFESAKKHLGFTSVAEETDQKPKKCEYYQCVLTKMQVTNQHHLPEFGPLKTRYEEQLPENTDDVKKCFAMAENIEQTMHSQEDLVGVIETDPSRTIKQARETVNEILCEVNSHTMQCLSTLTYKDSKCPLFVYP